MIQNYQMIFRISAAVRAVSKLKRITEGKTAIILTPDETYIDFADKTINLDNL